MLIFKIMAAASCLIVLPEITLGYPQPATYRERVVIHTPIKFKVIHHYKVQKVPLIIRKHLHYHQEIKENKVPIEEDDTNEIHHDYDTHQSDYVDDYKQANYESYHQNQGLSYYETNIGNHENFEENLKSQECEYDDYEYE